MKKEHTRNKYCKKCDKKFSISDLGLQFLDKVSPKFNGEKYSIPSPTLCADCRQQRRLTFRNERKLYKRKCDATGEDIISIYSPDKEYKVYSNDYWWSDKWDAIDYGKDFDFNKGFFEQFDKLLLEVPKISLSNINCENCDYGNGLMDSINCYLSFGSKDLKDSLYISTGSGEIKNSLDVLWSYMIEDSYEITHSDNLNRCFFCISCSNGYFNYFCNSCDNCKNCLFCFGLNNKQYCILNKEYSKEEYFEKLNEFFSKNDIIREGKKISREFFSQKARKAINYFNVENFTGDYIYDSKNIYNSFLIFDSEDFLYTDESGRSKNVMDGSYIYDCEGKILNTFDTNKSFNVIFSFLINNSRDIFYSHNLINCSSLFGCIGLKNKQYCILNKQYTKEEYNKLVPKIIKHMEKTGEWGEFFPSSLSPFGYNETIAQEYFPLEKEEAKNKGFNWSDYEPPKPNVEKVIPADKLPEDISDIPDDILNWAIRCEVTDKPYRIIKPELEFYRKHNLPIPRRHPDQRHLDRMKLRNPRKLWDRKCDKCGEEIKTTYSPDREEVVYCEKCYEKEIY